MPYQSPAPIRETGGRMAGGERQRPGPVRDRLFTPQLPRRGPPPVLARLRYDSPVLGGNKRNTQVRFSHDWINFVSFCLKYMLTVLNSVVTCKTLSG